MLRILIPFQFLSLVWCQSLLAYAPFEEVSQEVTSVYTSNCSLQTSLDGFVNNATLVPGFTGSAVSLSTNESTVSLGLVNIYDGDGMTIMFYFFLHSFADLEAESPKFVVKKDTVGEISWQLGFKALEQGQIGLEFSSRTTDSAQQQLYEMVALVEGSLYIEGAWNHLVVTTNFSILEFYLNGVYSPYGSLPTFFDLREDKLGKVLVGQEGDRGNPYLVDEIRIYDYYISEPEVEILSSQEAIQPIRVPRQFLPLQEWIPLSFAEISAEGSDYVWEIDRQHELNVNITDPRSPTPMIYFENEGSYQLTLQFLEEVCRSVVINFEVILSPSSSAFSIPLEESVSSSLLPVPPIVIAVGGIVVIVVIAVIVLTIVVIVKLFGGSKGGSSPTNLPTIEEGVGDVPLEEASAPTTKPSKSHKQTMNASSALNLRQDNSLGQRISVSDLKFKDAVQLAGFAGLIRGKWKDQTVAVKRVQMDGVSSEALEHFFEEVELLQRVNHHPNVVRYLGLTDEPLLLVMEYCSQGSLYSYLTSGNDVDMKDKVEHLLQIAKGLKHLSNENVLHKDLNTRHIMLDESLTAKVSDYAVNHMLVDEDNSSDLNMKWWAKETLQSKVFNEKTDIWSFGILCLEVLTQTEPFPTLSVEQLKNEVIKGTLNAKAEIPNKTPKKVKEIILQCLRASPASRPSWKEVVSALKSSQ